MAMTDLDMDALRLCEKMIRFPSLRETYSDKSPSDNPQPPGDVRVCHPNMEFAIHYDRGLHVLYDVARLGFMDPAMPTDPLDHFPAVPTHAGPLDAPHLLDQIGKHPIDLLCEDEVSLVPHLDEVVLEPVDATHPCNAILDESVLPFIQRDEFPVTHGFVLLTHGFHEDWR